MKRIVITGIGVSCSAGKNVNDFFSAISNPPRNLFNKSSKINLDINVIVGEASDESFSEPARKIFDNRTSRLCLTAAKESIAYLNQDDYPVDGLVVGTSTGGQSVCEEYLSSLLAGEVVTPINYRAQGVTASITRMVADELCIRGRVMTTSTACTSSANAIVMGMMLLENGLCQRVMVGGGDALCATTISSFHILGLTGEKPCRPFGENRAGMTLGDGAGFVILEPLNQVLRSNRNYYAEILGYGIGSDAFSMTSPRENGAGAITTMKSALSMSQLESCDVDFINAHGTGTIYNDRAEAIAIKSMFDNTPVASLKGLTGHTLGGAGVIELIASIYSISQQKAWENFNSYKLAADCHINIVPKGGLKLKENPVILSNSFAFGGNNCSLLLGRPAI